MNQIVYCLSERNGVSIVEAIFMTKCDNVHDICIANGW